MVREFLARNYLYIFIIVCVIILFCFFIGQKEGFHEDEIFSYGSSSYFYDNVFRPYGIEDAGGEFVRGKILQGNIIKNLKYYYLDHTDEKESIIEEYKAAHRPVWKSPEEADDYLTVKGWKEVVNYPIAYYNQAKDVHPPLFYFLVHTMQILFYGKFSKYVIFSINVCFAILSLVLIKRLMGKMKKEYLAIPAMILYGFSMGAISTVIFLRMYMMLSFFVLMFISVCFDIVKNNYEIDKKTWFRLGLVCILGYLTQYYFCIFAGVCALIIFAKICKKRDKKKIVSYLLNYLKIALIGIILYPFSINHIFFSYRGVGVSEMHKSYLIKLMDYFYLLGYSFTVPAVLFVIVILIALVMTIVKAKNSDVFKDYLVLLWLPFIMYILVITATAPEVERIDTLRYIMCLLPIASMLVIVIVDEFIRNKKVSAIVLTALVAIVSIYGLAVSRPHFLYEGYSNYLNVAQNNKDDRFVYVGDTVFNHMQSMQEFTIYKESLILNDDEIDYLIQDEVLAEDEEFILSIKKYKNVDGILNQIIEETEFKNAELLLDDDGKTDCIIYKMKKVKENEI